MTRCLIGYEELGHVSYVYCHNKGYLQGVGLTLQESYTDLSKIKKLIELGDMSYLGAELGPGNKVSSTDKYGFPRMDYVNNACEFYHRDRGDIERPIVTIPAGDFNNELRRAEGVVFLYLYKDGIWYFSEREEKFKMLSDFLVSRSDYE